MIENKRGEGQSNEEKLKIFITLLLIVIAAMGGKMIQIYFRERELNQEAPCKKFDDIMIENEERRSRINSKIDSSF